MLGTGSWGKELGGGTIDIDLNLSEWKLGGGVARLFGGGAGCGERVRFLGVFAVFLLKRFIEVV